MVSLFERRSLPGTEMLRAERRRVWQGRAIALALLVVSSAITTSAAAQGTHFIAEGTFGVSMPLGIETDQVRMSIGATAGFGGKVPGSLLRMYALAQFNGSQFSILREDLALERTLMELSGGGRVLFPLTSNLRLYADALLGLSWLTSEERSMSGRPVFVEDVEPRMSFTSALGIQFRPLIFLSVGAKTSFLFLLDDSYLPAEDISGCLNILGSVTLHF